MFEHSIERIFHEALGLPPGERRAFIMRACGADADRADELCRLVDAGAYMESQNELQNGEEVGPYKVIRQLGQGGMGAVYLAEQPALDRLVALKVIRSDREPRMVLGRFLAEQHALAQLVHPNIATLYEVGVTGNGQPFFAMEYVDGEPIDTYCDNHRLTIEDRLKLFLDLCTAVYFVHNQPVIHRDIKPGNVLVNKAGQVKLLDFGLAKPLSSALSGDTVGAGFLTTSFASPEQIRGDRLTLQSDGYSLGVVLYLLLTGRLPFNGIGAEMAQAVLQAEPQRPSFRVIATAGSDLEKLKDAAARRKSSPDQLSRRLRGDLDNIVLKALEKQPEKRYKSADQLAEDIQRHLSNMPVVARAPTWTYRAAKFVRRYRSGVIVAVVLLTVVVASSVAVERQAQVARMERARAVRRFNDVRHLANSFMFEFYETIAGVPGTTAAQELIALRAREYLDSLQKEAASDPELVRELATAYERVGDVEGDPYGQSLGQSDAALKSYQKARELRARLPVTARSRFELARSDLKIADIFWVQQKWNLAKQNYEVARQMDEASLNDDASNVDVKRHLALAYTGLGDTDMKVDDLASARNSHLRSQEIREQMAGSGTAGDRRNLAIGYVKLGDLATAEGDVPGAINQLKAALRILEALAAKDANNEQYRSNLIAILQRLGIAQLKTGSAVEAAETDMRAVRLATDALHADKSDATAKRNLANAESSLGDALLDLGSLSEGVRHLRNHLKLQQQLETADGANNQVRRDVWIATYQLGKGLLAAGEIAPARETLDDSLERALKLASEMPNDAQARDDVVDARVALGQALRAVSNVTGALDQFGQALGPARQLVKEHPAVTDYQSRLGLLLTELAATHEAAASRLPGQAGGQWRLAQDDWRQSVDVYEAMDPKGVLNGKDRGLLKRALRKVR